MSSAESTAGALRRPSEEAGAVEVFGGGGLEGREAGRKDQWMDGRAQFALFVCLFQRDRDRLPLIMEVEETQCKTDY